MPLVSLICESACAIDVVGLPTLPGFARHEFDMRPATHSASSMWLMQSEEPVPDGPVVGRNIFAEDHGFISANKAVRTRIFAHYWPERFNPAVWDEDIVPNKNWTQVNDESNEQWAKACGMVRLLQGQQWIIYWPILGHERHRLGDENKGIPKSITKTLGHWLDLIRNDLLPEAKPDLPILVHPDHGTARKEGNGFVEGFVLSKNVDLPSRCTWADIRKAERQCLGI